MIIETVLLALITFCTYPTSAWLNGNAIIVPVNRPRTIKNRNFGSQLI
jgi:hypothetical protein